MAVRNGAQQCSDVPTGASRGSRRVRPGVVQHVTFAACRCPQQRRRDVHNSDGQCTRGVASRGRTRRRARASMSRRVEPAYSSRPTVLPTSWKGVGCPATRALPCHTCPLCRNIFVQAHLLVRPPEASKGCILRLDLKRPLLDNVSWCFLPPPVRSETAAGFWCARVGISIWERFRALALMLFYHLPRAALGCTEGWMCRALDQEGTLS